MRRSISYIGVAVIVSVVLVACASDTPSIEPQQTSSPNLEPTQVTELTSASTPTTDAADTAPPTQVSEPVDTPSSTSTPEPTAALPQAPTPVPTATPIPTPTTRPTPTPIPNTPPVITNPGNKSYDQGETITDFNITITDAEDTPAVRLSGLPPGLLYQLGRVVGTIPSYAEARDYTATIFANDGSNPAVSTTFTITVNRAIASSQTCSDDWLIDAIVNLSEERESSFSPRILKLYTDKIEEVERTTKLLRCKAEAKMSQGGEVFLTYHYEIDRDGDGFIGYSVGDPVPPPGSTLNDAYAVGTVMTGSDGTQIRAISITADAWPLVYAENRFNDPPEEGNRFFMVRVEVVNPSDALQSVDVDDFDFKLIGDNRVVYSYSEGCGVIPDELDREIFPGGRAEGNVCFEVPETERGMILIHEPGYGTENRRFLILTD